MVEHHWSNITGHALVTGQALVERPSTQAAGLRGRRPQAGGALRYTLVKYMQNTGQT